MLEFYPANIADPASTYVSAAHFRQPIAQRFDARARRCVQARAIVIAFGVAVVLGGCATAPIGPQPPGAPPMAPPLPRNAEPPPPGVNLSGFPLPYRQGYADGCASVAGPERKDAARFAGDANYNLGWQDGLALCKRKYR